jgi:hypothetical protein
MLRISLYLILVFILTSCGDELSGNKYSDKLGLMTMEFKGSKVTFGAMGTEIEMDYKVEANKLKVTVMGVTQIYEIKDGKILTPIGQLYKLEKINSEATKKVTPVTKKKVVGHQVTSTMNNLQLNDAESVLQQLWVEEDACRGGPGDEKSTWAACERRDGLVKRLTELGWCWGPEDAAEYQKSWKFCVK